MTALPRLPNAALVLLTLVSVAISSCSTEPSANPDVLEDAADAAVQPDVGVGDVAVDTAIDTGPAYASEFTVVQLDQAESAPLHLAVRACAGLHNRDLGGSVYVRTDGHDDEWLEELALTSTSVVTAHDFLASCVAKYPTCTRYSYADQQALLPNILTVAAATGSIPLDSGLQVACDDVAFDAIAAFVERNTPTLATAYVFDNYVDQTSGLAMLNPGYDIHAPDLADPDLTGDMRASMVDFVFSKKLFVVFLINGCDEASPEYQVLYDIVNHGGWPTPIGVYGYNNSWLVAGYLHEAQTRCLESRNMGAIPTETGNLSFFSTRRAPVVDASELPQNAPEDVAYDPTKTYVAFVVGDGDNIRFIMSSRKTWLRQRLADCDETNSACAPLTWSISPHLADIAPDVLKWYYASSQQTGQDYFILPPSGHLYAYPSSLAEAAQTEFVTATEKDARLLGVSSTVHWDWFDTWADAEDIFLPKYATAGGAIRGIFPVNVPYMFPMFTWWAAEEFYRVLTGADGSKAVVFRQREWRGIDDGLGPTGNEAEYFLNPQKMADELGNYPPGTVTWVYMTSDGGLTLENSFMELVKLLPANVQLVNADTAAKLAIAAGE